MSPTNYVNDHTRLLDRLAQQADAFAASASVWLEKLTTAKADAATAEENFLTDFAESNALALADAKNRVRNLQHLADALENGGGPDEVRRRALRTPAVFAAFRKGFEERIEVLNKSIPAVRKRLGARRNELSEIGLSTHEIERDPTVFALVQCANAIANGIAAATASQVYAADRGVNRTPRTFEQLYQELTAPIPQATN